MKSLIAKTTFTKCYRSHLGLFRSNDTKSYSVLGTLQLIVHSVCGITRRLYSDKKLLFRDEGVLLTNLLFAYESLIIVDRNL